MSTDATMTAAEALKAWLERAHMEPRDLAPLIGCSRPRVYSLIDGSKPPSLTLAAKIEETCGIPAVSWTRTRTAE